MKNLKGSSSARRAWSVVAATVMLTGGLVAGTAGAANAVTDVIKYGAFPKQQCAELRDESAANAREGWRFGGCYQYGPGSAGWYYNGYYTH